MNLPSVAFHCDIARVENRYIVDWRVAIVGGTPQGGVIVLQNRRELSDWLASMASNDMVRQGESL